MINSIPKVPAPRNEPVYDYAPGSPERKALKRAIESMGATPIDIPLVIGAERRKGAGTAEVRSPHDHKRVLAKYAQASGDDAARAIDAALAAAPAWSRTPLHERLAIFLRAADLLAT